MPGTKIRRYELPIDGTGIRQIGENQCIIADREKIYAQISGTSIFDDSFILTDDKSIVDASREQKMFSDILHTKVKDSEYIETEAFIGYNDNQIIFIYDRGKSNERRLISSEAIQTFEREDIEHPVTMFSTGDTIGFIDGKKVRISDVNGEISTFELEEDIQNIDIQNGYVLINGNILCCGARYRESSYKWEEKKISPFCKKINNPEMLKRFMQVSNSIEENSIEERGFIENKNGCFFIDGLTEEERLKLYQENGFSELYKNLEEKILKKQETERKKQQKIEEAKNKTSEYLKGKLLSLCHMRGSSWDRREIIEADNVEFVESDNAVLLFENQEKGWAYGPVYEVGIINVKEARRKINRNKKKCLHLDVPEDVMGVIIGRKGSNINRVTDILREKGIDLSRIILHPKSREEIKITLENIEKAIKEQRAQGYDD